jgi:hypothetical protein
MELPKDRIEIASDVSNRDGIGIEVYRNNKMVAEIFRDDTKKTRTITLYEEVSLELMEESIEIFKNSIPWDYIDYDMLSSSKLNLNKFDKVSTIIDEPSDAHNNQK